jgi:hypothetical protein
MSAQHTPAPWFVFSSGHCIGGPKLDRDPPTAGIAMFSMGARSPEENRANAAYAVKCVNAHDDMLKALRRAVLALAFAAESSPAMRDDYEAVSAAIAKATAA